jgi:hypothetical protein
LENRRGKKERQEDRPGRQDQEARQEKESHDVELARVSIRALLSQEIVCRSSATIGLLERFSRVAISTNSVDNLVDCTRHSEQTCIAAYRLVRAAQFFSNPVFSIGVAENSLLN